MLTIDLSRLSAHELRRLRDAAQTRGQDALVEQLNAQLNAAALRHLRGPQPIPAPTSAVRAHRDDPAPQRRPNWWARGALFAAALGAGTVALAVDLRAPEAPAPEAAAEAETPVLRPRLEMAISAPAPAIEPAAMLETSVVAPPEAPAPPQRRANPCYAKATPADRLVCGYPTLAQQDRLLKAAFERAVAAGADPHAVARDQAAWKAESDGVSDRHRLADLYQARISELEATAAAAETLSTP